MAFLPTMHLVSSASAEKRSRISSMAGAPVFAVCAVMFRPLLPSRSSSFDRVQVVVSSDWLRWAFVILLGVVLMLVECDRVNPRTRTQCGSRRAVRFL
jgi:hypothetical protein